MYVACVFNCTLPLWPNLLLTVTWLWLCLCVGFSPCSALGPQGELCTCFQYWTTLKWQWSSLHCVKATNQWNGSLSFWLWSQSESHPPHTNYKPTCSLRTLNSVLCVHASKLNWHCMPLFVCIDWQLTYIMLCNVHASMSHPPTIHYLLYVNT